MVERPGRRVWSAARRRVVRAAVRLAVPTRPGPDLTRLGTDYGGWWVPTSLFDGPGVAYCVGVGEDASFDLALADGSALSVHSFDPTPRSVAFAAQLPAPANWSFEPTGLWSETTSIGFHAPRDPNHVSHSIVNLQQTDVAFVASVESVADAMDRLGHASLRLIKLDIEGAEHVVLDAMLDAGITPEVVCFEFDQPGSVRRLRASHRRLLQASYALVHRELDNFTYVRTAGVAIGAVPAVAPVR